MTIGINVASLRVQNKLGESSAKLGVHLERLASGQRINRASDDAAGLAISESLQVKNRVYGQAYRNLNDGVSLLSIAESAVDQMKQILFRLRELSTQAANGTFSAAQRGALDSETGALAEEYNRIIKSTEYNGRNVFDEKSGALVLQGGFGESATLTLAADATFDGPDRTTRVSTSSTGAEGSGGAAQSPAITPDGRYVIFQASFPNLIGSDSNGFMDIFMKDLSTGNITRVNTTSSGTQLGGGFSSYGRVTPDGRFVTFASAATNAVPNDTNGCQDIFLKDTLTGQLTRVSTDSDGNQAVGGDSDGAAKATADGRYVIFQSAATNLVENDTNGVADIFLKDTLTGVTRRINTDSNGNQALGGTSVGPAITSDGRYAFFESYATNLMAGDTGMADIFRKDLITGELTCVSTNSAGTPGSGGHSLSASISSDGRYVAFQSAATDLVAGDTNGRVDVFLKDMTTGSIRRVSTSTSGGQASGADSYVGGVSADGRFVTFASDASNLSSNDTNGQSDVFVKDMATGETRLISVSENGSQAAGGGSNAATVTPDGRTIAFVSAATNLVGNDSNGQADVFVLNNPLAPRFSLNLLSAVSMRTQSGARWVQGHVDNYLEELNVYQGQLGGLQKRIEVAGNVLSATRDNILAAQGRIKDADIASETAGLLSARMLQEAGAAILAQANQQPSLALTLLG